MARFMRGQAAMEYLVTYGWALIALFAVIAILVSTGAFSSANFSQQECTFQPALPCFPFILYQDNSGAAPATTLQYTLSNDLGFPIEIASVTYKTNGIGVAGVKDDWDGTASCLPVGTVVAPGTKINCSFTFEGDQQPRARDFQTIVATVSYFNCKGVESDCNAGTAAQYTTAGRISTLVEQGIVSQS